MLTPTVVLAVAASLGACSDATAPSSDASSASSLMSASAHAGASIVLDDASSRIASAVESVEHRARLVRLLDQLQGAVQTEDFVAARQLLASTRTVLTRGTGLDASDADALFLSLDAVEADLPPANARGARTTSTTHQLSF